MRTRLPRLASVAVQSSPSSSPSPTGANPSPASSSSSSAADSSWSRSHSLRLPTNSATRPPPPKTLPAADRSTGTSSSSGGDGQLGNAVQGHRERPGPFAHAGPVARASGSSPFGSQLAAGRAGSRRARPDREVAAETTDRPAEPSRAGLGHGLLPVAGPSGLRSASATRGVGTEPSLRTTTAAAAASASSRRAQSLPQLETRLALPTSEPELYDFLRRTKTAYTSLPPEWLAAFHGNENLADLVSSRTYRFLVRVAFAASNLRLVRTLLAEVKERGVPLDEVTKRAILRGYATCGPRALRSEDDAVRTALADELARAAGEGATRPTRRRNFGCAGKGSHDLDELWKGWAVRGRDRRVRDHVDALLLLSPESRSPPTKNGSSSPRARARARAHLRVGRGGEAATAVPTRLQRIALSRPPVLIPPLAHRLPGSDMAGLVQALVSTGRRTEAFDLAEAWLAANRPVFDEDPPGSLRPADPPPSTMTGMATTATTTTTTTSRRAGKSESTSRPPSLAIYLRQAAAYHSTAVVLLNILLKPLFLECAPVPVIRSFVTSFVDTHSAARPAAPLLPDLVTLRTLVTGVLGSRTAWDRATSLVDWFGYQWGIPVADPSVRTRHRFLPPSEIGASRLAVVAPPSPSRSGLGAVEAAPQPRLLLVKPHVVVPPDVALLLLRHAADQYARGLGAAAPAAAANHRRVWRQGIRAWWRGLDRDSSATDVWTGQKARAVVNKAVKVGLFKPKQLVRAARRHELEEGEAAP